MWVEEYLERERKSLRPARALPKYLMATNEEVCKEIQTQSHSGHESYWLDPIWWGKEDTSQTQFAVLFPHFCYSPILYRRRTASKSACTYQYYRSCTFFIQNLFLSATTKNKKEKTSHQNRKVWRGEDRADGPQTAHSHHLLWHIPNHYPEVTLVNNNYPQPHSPTCPWLIHPRKTTAWILHLSLPNASFPWPASLNYND